MSVVDLIGIINFTTPLNNVDEKATEFVSLGVIVNGPETRDMCIRRLQVFQDCVSVHILI